MNWNEFKNKVEKELDEKGVSHSQELQHINYRVNQVRLKVENDIYFGITVN